MLKIPKTFLGWKILAPSKHILAANIQIRVIALRFEIVEKDAVHDHEDDAILHQGDDA